MKNNLTEYFKNTVAKFPDNTAIDDNQAVLSFAELNKISDQIAVEIISKTKGRNQPIAVYLPKNRWSVASFIGIFKSGNFYIPLNTKSAGGHVLKIIQTLRADLIITDFEHKEELINLGYKGNIISIETVLDVSISDAEMAKLDQIANSIIDLDPIYSIFTSGSTGAPKGVLISHRGVIDFIEWAITTYDLSNKTSIGNQVPFYFDMSVLDIYLMVFTGATLQIIPEDRFAFPIKLIEYVNEKNINFIFWVPSVLNSVSNFDAFSVIKPSSLEKILFAGEVMSNKHLNYWRKHHPNALYSNLYGPTEITVIATYFIVNRAFKDDEPLPIGKACKNTQTLILSDKGQLIKKGETGELYLRGSLLALGYYNDIEKTKEVFVQNPLHNTYSDVVYKTGDLVYENDLNDIVFVGRKDSQIKHLGYRIELGEIETAISGIKAVGNACVLYNDNQKKIVAFINHYETSAQIRKKLSHSLPKYMIPTKWITIEKFPLNANGKIDRQALKSMV